MNRLKLGFVGFVVLLSVSMCLGSGDFFLAANASTTANTPPILYNASVSPYSGSWNDTYTYKVNVSDGDGDSVNVTLQIFTNEQWINVGTKQALGNQSLAWKYRFTCLDRSQTARYRYYYYDDWFNTGYYPSLDGASGPLLDNTSYGLGIVEGAGAGYGSSFYTWSDHLFTIVQPNDKVFIATSEPVNNIRIYDYTTAQWYTYDLDKSYGKGKGIYVTFAFKNHLNKFVQVKAYYNDLAKSFHIVKKTPTGGIVEGGYPGYGSSFTSWSTYANTIVLPGDSVYVTSEYAENKVGIYNYSSDKWNYYNLSINAPANELLDISSYVQQYTNRFVQIKTLTDSTERNFHIIKRTKEGGIVEGAEGGTAGSSFCSWYSSLYTIVQEGDHVFVAADNLINKTGIYDYTTEQWNYYNLNRTYARGEVVDIGSLFDNCTNHIVQIKVYQDSTTRNFHLVKISPGGGIVEGSYPNADSSFNSWANDMYTLFSHDDRILIAPTDYIDTIKVYDYADDQWHTINLGGNVYSKYSLVDVTPYISKHEGNFIRLQVYYQASQKSFHLIKAKEGIVFDKLSDLTLNTEDITFSNDNQVEGGQITFSALIRNEGEEDATNFIVEFFDGNTVNGTKIGEDFLYLINPGSAKKLSIRWNVSAGIHDIYVVIDRLNIVSESNETNNVAFNTIRVLPDLTLSAEDITFSALYRVPVTIYENSGEDLCDYQVNLTVDTAELIKEGKMRQDCGDIRFKYYNSTSGEEEEIPYWIEAGCNSENTRIWVKVPFIQANGTATVYMHYGNLSGVSESNGSAVFEFFDDFEDPSTLTNYDSLPLGGNDGENTGAGTWIISDGILKPDTSNKHYGALIKNLNPADIVIGAKVKSAGDDDSAGIVFRYNAFRECYGALLNFGDTSWGAHTGLTGRNADRQEEEWDGGEPYASVSKNVWHIIEARILGQDANIKAYLFIDGQQMGTIHTPTSNYYNSGRMGLWTAAMNPIAEFDDFRVCKYISPEPTTTVGPEQFVKDVPVTINATIHNIGGVNATNVAVQFYDGDPDNGGILIGNRTIDCILKSGAGYDTDLDEDGKSELIFGTYSNGVYIVDPVTKTTLWNYNPGSWSNALAIGDVDNDGKPELIFSCGQTNRFYVYGYNGAYPLVQEFSANVGDIDDAESGITTGDVDGDGTAEIILPDASTNPDHIEIWGWNGNTFVLEDTFSPSGADGIHSIAAEDVDNDGTVEIIFNEYQDYGVALHIYGYDGSNYVKEWVSADLGGYLQGIVIGDTDNDGYKEIWTGDRDHYGTNDGAVFVYQYTSPGVYTQEWISAYRENGLYSHNSPTSIADWDNDGKKEIAIGCYQATDGYGHVWVYEYDDNNKKYVLEWDVRPPSNDDHTTTPTFGDYDNDGTMELMIGDESGYVYIYNPDGVLEWSNGDYGQHVAGWSGDAALITGEPDPRSPELTAGKKEIVSITFNATPGVHDIYVVVDPKDDIAERNETNNVAHKVLSIEAMPDLAINSSDISFSNDNPAEGEFVSINVTIHNIGDAPAFDVPVKVYCPNEIDSSTVGLWHFDENSGNTAYDSSGYNNHGTLVNNPTWVDGKFGSGLRCDGNTEYVNLPVIEVCSTYTLEAWSEFPLYNTGSWRTLFQRQGGTYHHILVDVNGFLGVYNNGFYSSEYDVDILSGWHHITAVASEGVTKFYIDGSYIGTSNTVVTEEVSRIGNHNSGQQWGTFDEVVIYNRALTPEEIKIHYGSRYYIGGVIATKTSHNIAPNSTATIQIIPSNDYDPGWILTSGVHDIHIEIDPANIIPEQNETNNLASKTINVTDNNAPILSNATVSPTTGSWKDNYTYSLNISDIEADNVNVTLQIFTNEHWTYLDTKTINDTGTEQTLSWTHTFTAVDRTQTAKYRFYYEDYVTKDAYYSGTINSGYYPSANGSSGPVLNNTSYGLGIVEGAGTGRGSSFYSWSGYLYTAVQPTDKVFIAASEPVDNIRIYDHVSDKWHTYDLDRLYDAGKEIDITSAFQNHLNHFVQVKAYASDNAKNFHIIKQTLTGGTVESGYPGSGSSFTSWSKYAFTIVREGDSIYIAPDAFANKIGIYDYLDEHWHYYNLSDTAPRGVLTDITYLLTPYLNHIIQIKVLQGTTERNFHIIKRTAEGGIVEGAEGGSGGSSFYSWYSSLYTSVLSGDRVFVAADKQFNTIKVHDYTTDQWETISLDRRYNRSETADITQYLQKYVNHLIQLQVFHYENQRSFHLVKITPDGGIVEGGYPNTDSSFNTWANDMYILFKHGDRILVASSDNFDMIKIYDYADDQWHTINLGNIYPKYTLVDLTPYITKHEGNFIRLQLYHQTSQKNFHLIKAYESVSFYNNPPELSNASLSPSSGSWKDNYTYSVSVNDTDSERVNVTLQVFTNGQWINVKTKLFTAELAENSESQETHLSPIRALRGLRGKQIRWNYQFTCLDRNQTAKYRFYYDDGIDTGYYPSEAGVEGPELDDTSYGLGIVEGAGAGYGSSFYSWSGDLYTVVQRGDYIHVTASDSINKVGVYDYSDDKWYYYWLNESFVKGKIANITNVFHHHLNHFIRINVYFNDMARSFHIVKQTSTGGTVEGGYSGYGSSFTSWSTYANTVIRNGDRIYVAADAPFNRIWIYDYIDEHWNYYDLNGTFSKGVLTDITHVLTPYLNHAIQIKVLQDDTERNFHIIKRTAEGGIVEGAEGNRGGSSFYPWYSSLYTAIQKGDHMFVSASEQFNSIKVHDYTTGQWEKIRLDRRYERSEMADVSLYLQKYANHIIQLQVYHYANQRSFHMVKITPEGGIVEGGYPDSHSSFGSWSNDIYTLFRLGDRIIIASNDYIDTLKVYDFTDDEWHIINLSGNVYQKYSLVDITPYISAHEGHLVHLQVYYQTSQKSFHTLKAFEKQPVTSNKPPVLSNEHLSPTFGSWKNEYFYSVHISDEDSEDVDVTLQVFINGQWKTVEKKSAYGTYPEPQHIAWRYNFTCVDRNQTAKYRFYYDDGVNTGYYPSESGVEGPTLDSTSYGVGIVEGAGAGYGSSFYSWSGDLYTVVQPCDCIYVTASDSINKVGIYDYSVDNWYYHRLNGSFLKGETANITAVFQDHLNHFVRVKVYFNDMARNFHIIKQTPSGGIVEGGYPGYGSSFTTWSKYANMIFREGDRVLVAPDAPANRIGVYDYESWEYYNLSEAIPKGVSTNISHILIPYSDHIIQIKVIQDDTERNFHIIKKTAEGGIVEGAQGDSGGSSFYSWYSSLYTAVLSGDRVFVAADNSFNTIKVHDYTVGQWETIRLEQRYEKSDVADVSSYLQKFVNRMVQIQVYDDTTLRNFHLLKMSPCGGIVEGGYPDSHSSFGSWSNDMYTLFRKGDRLVIAPTDYIDTIKVYDYTADKWHTIALGNVYPKYLLVDITPYISEHEGHFIKLETYYQQSQKSFHTIKATCTGFVDANGRIYNNCIPPIRLV